MNPRHDQAPNTERERIAPAYDLRSRLFGILSESVILHNKEKIDRLLEDYSNFVRSANDVGTSNMAIQQGYKKFYNEGVGLEAKTEIAGYENSANQVIIRGDRTAQTTEALENSRYIPVLGTVYKPAREQIVARTLRDGYYEHADHAKSHRRAEVVDRFSNLVPRLELGDSAGRLNDGASKYVLNKLWYGPEANASIKREFEEKVRNGSMTVHEAKDAQEEARRRAVNLGRTAGNALTTNGLNGYLLELSADVSNPKRNQAPRPRRNDADRVDAMVMVDHRLNKMNALLKIQQGFVVSDKVDFASKYIAHSGLAISFDRDGADRIINEAVGRLGADVTRFYENPDVFWNFVSRAIEPRLRAAGHIK